MKRFFPSDFAPFVLCTAVLLAGCRKPAPEAEPPPIPPATAMETKIESPAPASAQSSAPLPTPGSLLPEIFASERAWWAKYKLNADDPEVLAGDPDKDGYSNREEYLADTNPLDPESHPVYAVKLRVTEVREVPLPVVLESVEGGKAKIRLSGPQETTRTVGVGDRIPGMPFTVESVRFKPSTDKFGEPLDLSEVALKNTESGGKAVLVKGTVARSPDSFAVLTLPDGEGVKVMQDEVFSLPREPQVKYRVLDIRKTEVVIEDVESRKVITVPPAATIAVEVK